MRRAVLISLLLPLVGPPLPFSDGLQHRERFVATAPQDTARMYMVRMEGIRSPHLYGSAGFVPLRSQTVVAVGVRGAVAGSTLEGHIHRGDTCDSPGDVVLPLRPLRVGSDGTGKTSSRVNATIHAIFDGNHLVLYHLEGENGRSGRAIICGDIPVMLR